MQRLQILENVQSFQKFRTSQFFRQPLSRAHSAAATATAAAAATVAAAATAAAAAAAAAAKKQHVLYAASIPKFE